VGGLPRQRDSVSLRAGRKDRVQDDSSARGRNGRVRAALCSKPSVRYNSGRPTAAQMEWIGKFADQTSAAVSKLEEIKAIVRKF
jgi:hypothetical protein